jgi:hypothetical protein
MAMKAIRHVVPLSDDPSPGQPRGDAASRGQSATRCPRHNNQPAWPGRMVLAAVAFVLLSPTRAHAEAPAAACARLSDDDTALPIPAFLVPAVNALFGTRMSMSQAVDATVFRCANGRVLVCASEANLPCGPANSSRVPGSGTVDWCRDHANAAFIPAVVTGHDTIFAWECRNRAPRIARQFQAVDTRGFITQYWKELPE